mmetsp:Transcript_9885/g.14572  ORF Transcript_9885/g.14572 Transcript_9885/m.14572 type:complete len:339 (+) Transcript_9885:14-1030(+)
MYLTSFYDAKRPSYFEVIPIDTMVPSLRHALHYISGLIVQRNFNFAPLLTHFEELFSLLHGAIEWHYLRHYQATFSERFYGLKRVDVHHPTKKALSRSHILSSLFFVVGIPYCRHKGKQIYDSLKSRPIDSLSTTELQFKKYWPYLIRLHDLVHFIYLFFYLCNRHAMHHSPFLHLQSLQLQRLEYKDMLLQMKHLWSTRIRRLYFLNSHRFFSLFTPLLKGVFLLQDVSRKVLIFAAFLFTLFEWWYSTEHLRVARKTIMVPKSAPSRPTTLKSSRLPSNLKLCPICKQERTNPTLLSSSGYVFCFKCITHYVKTHSKCPLTDRYSHIDHLRRIFDE